MAKKTKATTKSNSAKVLVKKYSLLKNSKPKIPYILTIVARIKNIIKNM